MPKNIESQPDNEDNSREGLEAEEYVPEALPTTEEELEKAKKEGKYIDTSKEAGTWIKIPDSEKFFFLTHEKEKELIETVNKKALAELEKDQVKIEEEMRAIEHRTTVIRERIERLKKIAKTKEDFDHIYELMKDGKELIEEDQKKLDKLIKEFQKKWN